MYKNNINSAFEILLEEVEKAINELNHEGQLALNNGDYKKAKLIIDNAEKITTLREKIKELQKEWSGLVIDKLPRKTSRKKEFKKLERGLKTPQDTFRIPILESLVELGGKAKMKDVLKKVHEKMKNRLNQYDLSGLPFNPSTERWKNTAQWCRYALVKEGLLLADSPRGIWGITPEGRMYLEEHTKKSQ